VFRHDRDAGADELAWLAFLYAAGELDGAAAADFERRLDADQSAREAVAEAVLLVAAAATAGAPAVAARRRSRAAVAATLTLAAAAGLAALFAATGWLASPKNPRGVPGAAAESVALAWSGLRDDQDGVAPPRDDLVAWLDEAPDAVPSEPTGDDDAPPPWLLEAARLRETPAPDGRGS